MRRSESYSRDRVFRMRTLIVIDVELEKSAWPLRNWAAKKFVTEGFSLKSLPTTVKVKRTHMHGCRLVFENYEVLENYVKTYQTINTEANFTVQSESRYASIFFFQCQRELLSVLTYTN